MHHLLNLRQDRDRPPRVGLERKKPVEVREESLLPRSERFRGKSEKSQKPMVVTEDEPSDFRSSVKLKQIVVIGPKTYDLDQAKSQKSERFKNRPPPLTKCC